MDERPTVWSPEKKKKKQKRKRKKKKKKKKRAISSDDISRIFKCRAFAKNPSTGPCHATGLAVVEPRHKGLLARSRWKADRDRPGQRVPKRGGLGFRV